MKHTAIDGMLRPKTIAVVGASATPGKIGYTVLANLLESKFEGKIFPINPTAQEILGLKVYAEIADVPEQIDAAIITVPAKFVPEVTEECGKKGVKGLIRKHVDLIDDIYPEPGHGRRELYFLPQVPDFVNTTVGGGVYFNNVNGQPIGNAFTDLTAVAGLGSRPLRAV